ncbi:hypothetical protein B0J11DRAFT_610918 [Dendryphion nanum]|uniref:Uncharacterized protein n=1 Tax=Dendryphion nanum TaxID=256645 RepID=A0A9P9EHC6_9PLEO|nr:hypothetical protein B0J11DRAFT_610918 [Dendryphion nanum]
MKPPGSPSKLNDYLYCDIPQLGLHVVTFTDNTLMTIYWPHICFDAIRQKEILDAWILVMQGREDEIDPPFGTDSDPFIDLGRRLTEPHQLLTCKLGVFSLILYALRQISILFQKLENRMVCVPESFLAQLRATAVRDLSTIPENSTSSLHIYKDTNTGLPFLSKSDVLCAWWTRLLVSHLPTNSSQTISINNVFDFRKTLQADMITHVSSYISTAFSIVSILLPARFILQKPLAYVAAAVVANIIDDAVVPTPCRPKYIQNNQFGFNAPEAFIIIGKGLEGNFWFLGHRSKEQWRRIERILQEEN